MTWTITHASKCDDGSYHVELTRESDSELAYAQVGLRYKRDSGLYVLIGFDIDCDDADAAAWLAVNADDAADEIETLAMRRRVVGHA
jgi:hypothetical protein